MCKASHLIRCKFTINYIHAYYSCAVLLFIKSQSATRTWNYFYMYLCPIFHSVHTMHTHMHQYINYKKLQSPCAQILHPPSITTSVPVTKADCVEGWYGMWIMSVGCETWYGTPECGSLMVWNGIVRNI